MITDRREIAAAVIAADGDLERVATDRDIPRSTVAAVARRFGWPDLDAMREAVSIPPLSELVERAREAGVSLSRFSIAVRELSAEVEAVERHRAAEAAREQARRTKLAQVEQMRARLAAAEAELAAMPRPEPSPAELRAWAIENGIACPAKGKVPQRVRDAWWKAHP